MDTLNTLFVIYCELPVNGGIDVQPLKEKIGRTEHCILSWKKKENAEKFLNQIRNLTEEDRVYIDRLTDSRIDAIKAASRKAHQYISISILDD